MALNETVHLTCPLLCPFSQHLVILPIHLHHLCNTFYLFLVALSSPPCYDISALIRSAMNFLPNTLFLVIVNGQPGSWPIHLRPGCWNLKVAIVTPIKKPIQVHCENNNKSLKKLSGAAAICKFIRMRPMLAGRLPVIKLPLQPDLKILMETKVLKIEGLLEWVQLNLYFQMNMIKGNSFQAKVSGPGQRKRLHRALIRAE